MRGLLISALVVIVSTSAATAVSTAATRRSADFPINGVVVPGQTIGGIALGMSQAQVEQLWGRNFIPCATCGPDLTWLYEYPGGDAVLGAAVKFSAPSGSSTTSVAAATAAAATASTAALAATKKAKLAQTEATTASAAAKTDESKALLAKAAAAKAKPGAADRARLETAARTALARASTAKITAAKDASLAKAAETAATAAAAAAAKAETAAKAAVAASTAGVVTAVFTLGSPVGWGLTGVKMGDPVSNLYNLYNNPGNVNCVGYGALTIRAGNSTTSFYSANGVIYGFALTAPSQSPCQ